MQANQEQNRLNEKIADKERDIEELREKINSSSLESGQEYLVKLQRDLQESQREIKELQEQKVALEDELQKARLEYENNKATQTAQIEQEKKGFKDQVEKNYENLVKKEREIQELQEQINSFPKKSDQEAFAQLQEDLKKEQSAKEKLQTKFEESEKKVKACEEEIKKVQGELKQQKEKFDKGQEEYQNRQRRNSDTSKKTNKNLQASIGEKQEDICRAPAR